MNVKSIANEGVALATMALVALSASAAEPGRKHSESEAAWRKTATLELRLPPNETREVEVALGQTAREIVNRLQPARPAVDDDPWLLYPAAGGGYYALLFSADGSVKEIEGRLDPSRDQLYAVIKYPGEPVSGGKYLLPERLHESTAGEFITLKVRLGDEKARAATVTLGMKRDDVMRLYRPAEDRSMSEGVIVFDSVDGGGRYLLVFSAAAEQQQGGTLTEVLYWPGGEECPAYLLPQQKRGEAIPEHLKRLMTPSPAD